MLHLRIVLGGLGQALLVHAHTHVTLMLCMLKPGCQSIINGIACSLNSCTGKTEVLQMILLADGWLMLPA